MREAQTATGLSELDLEASGDDVARPEHGQRDRARQSYTPARYTGLGGRIIRCWF